MIVFRQMRVSVAWWTLCILLLAMPAFAQDSEPRTQTVGEYLSQQFGEQFIGPPVPEPREWHPDESSMWAPDQAFLGKLQQVSIVLVFICVLAFALLQLLMRMSPKVLKGSKKKKLVTVLDRQAIGPRRAVHTLEVGGKILVVGMTEQNMQTLCELTREEYEAAMAPEPAEAPEVEDDTEADPERKREGYQKIVSHYLSILPKMGARHES